MTSEIVPVHLEERTYEIVIGDNLLSQCGTLCQPLLSEPHVTVVCDKNVEKLHLQPVMQSFADANIKATPIILDAGEKMKSFSVLETLLNALIEEGLERHATIVALGGGVIGDLAGFAAAIALRGIDFIQIPTTLLAQVDSAVGGKTGINVPAGKNLVGAFHQPRLVIADVTTLDSLTPRELKAGYAEVVKYGLIDDPDFFSWIEKNGVAVLKGDWAVRIYAVKKSCEVKAAIVAKDEREGGQRALLNLGHTFGHALEGACAYDGRLIHGEAVAIGMCLAFELSHRLGFCPLDDLKRVRKHFTDAGLPSSLHDIENMTWDHTDLIERMGRDKKTKHGKLTFVLARGIGQAFLTQDVPIADLTTMLEQAIAQ